FGDPLELLEQVLAVGHDRRARGKAHRAEALQAAPRGDAARAQIGRKAPRQDEPARGGHAASGAVSARRVMARSPPIVPAAAAAATTQPAAQTTGSRIGETPRTSPPSDGPRRKPPCQVSAIAPR